MSEPTTVAAPAAETKVDDVKPVEAPTLPTETAPAAAEAAPVVPEQNAEEAAFVAAATGEEKPVEAAAATPAATAADEPISAGVLGYKAPGIMHFKFSKRYVWLGDEAVSTQNLSHYLRGTEARIAHPVAAWSSQTGKGLLYLVKAESEKKHPQDVFPLADATDLQKASPHEFSFKIHGEKHAFKASSDAERNGWFVAIEKAVEEAKASKDSIRKSDGYQESVKHLGKPAIIAGGIAGSGAAAAAAAKKEEHHSTTPAVTEPTEAAPAETRPSNSDEDLAKKAQNERKKSRSASRKRNSMFGNFLGKKEDKTVKKDEDKTEEKHIAEGAAAGTAVAGGAAAVAAEDKHEEAKTDALPETTDATATAPVASTEEPAATSKPAKRNSIFGSIYQKVRSPTTEKKEFDVAPVVPPKDETPTAAEPLAPATAEPVETSAATSAEPVEAASHSNVDEAAIPAVAAASAVAAEEHKEEKKKVETPKKEKESFLGSMLNKVRAKSPSTGKRDAKETTPVADAPAVPPKDEAPVEETKAEEAVPAVASTTEPAVATEPETAAAPAAETTETKPSAKESRRRSLFSFNNKDGDDGEKPFNKLGSMFRRPSQAARAAGDKKENVAPVAAEETATEGSAPVATTAETEGHAATEAEKPTEAIGDVPAEAVSVGQPQEANPAVSATA